MGALFYSSKLDEIGIFNLLAAQLRFGYLQAMKFTLADNSGNYIIRSYDPGEVVIDDYRYNSSVIVTPKQIIDNWPPQSFTDLAPEHFNSLIDLNPQLIILGTGTTQQFPRPELYASLVNQGMGIEVMATSAACRTYNILVAEGRNVAAALLLI